MFIMAYEIFKNGILEYVRSFFWNGFNEKGPVYSPEYYERFFGKKPYDNPLAEALKLFLEFGALSNEDVNEVHRLRLLRNGAAHRLMHYLIDDANSLIENSDIKSIVDLNYKLDNWWINNMEVHINPLLENEENEIVDGASLVTYLLDYCYKSLKK